MMISQRVTLIDQGRQVVATAQVVEQDGACSGRRYTPPLHPDRLALASERHRDEHAIC